MRVPVKYRKYDYSVIQVAKDLHEHAVGVAEGLQDYVLMEMQDWLEWRISDRGWDPSTTLRIATYEEAVRSMAQEALKIAKTGLWNPKKSSPIPMSIQDLEAAACQAINELKQRSLGDFSSLEDPRVADYHRRVQAIREKMIEVERKLVAMVTDFQCITYEIGDHHTQSVDILPSTDPASKSGLWRNNLPLSQWSAFTLLTVAGALPIIVARVKENNRKQAECYQRLEAAEKGLSQL